MKRFLCYGFGIIAIVNATVLISLLRRQASQSSPRWFIEGYELLLHPSLQQNNASSTTNNETNSKKKLHHFSYSKEGQSYMNLWQKRFAPKRGGFIFFKHIRKAGGSSMRKYLYDVMMYKSEQERGMDVSFYEQEFNAMDWRCPQLDAPRWNVTLSVIVLRHPVERILSEFFYSGPGKKHKKLRSLHKRREYTNNEFTELLREEFPNWMKQGMRATAAKKFPRLGRYFSDNYQVRVLAGETGYRPEPYQGPRLAKKCSQTIFPVKDLIKISEKPCRRSCVHGCEGPCRYGRGGFNGGSPTVTNVTNTTFQRALRVLRQFDVVLITESLQQQASFLADIMNVPMAHTSITDISLRATTSTTSSMSDNNNRQQQQQQQQQQNDAYQAILQRTAPELLNLIQEHCEFEMELYRHAVQLNRNSILQWEREKQRMMEVEV